MAYMTLLRPAEMQSIPFKPVTFGMVALPERCPATIYSALVGRITDNTAESLMCLFYDMYSTVVADTAETRFLWYRRDDPINVPYITRSATSLLIIIYTHLASLVAAAIYAIDALPQTPESKHALQTLATAYLPSSYMCVFNLPSRPNLVAAIHDAPAAPPTRVIDCPTEFGKTYTVTLAAFNEGTTERVLFELCRPFFCDLYEAFLPGPAIDVDVLVAITESPHAAHDSLYFALAELAHITSHRNTPAIKKTVDAAVAHSFKTKTFVELSARYHTWLKTHVLSDPHPLFADTSFTEHLLEFIETALQASYTDESALAWHPHAPGPSHPLSRLLFTRQRSCVTSPFNTSSPMQTFANLSTSALAEFITYASYSPCCHSTFQPVYPYATHTCAPADTDAIIQILHNVDAYTNTVLSAASTLFAAPFVTHGQVPHPIFPQLWSDILFVRMYFPQLYRCHNEQLGAEYETLFDTICTTYRTWRACTKDPKPTTDILHLVHPILNLRRIASHSTSVTRTLLNKVQRYICSPRNLGNHSAPPPTTADALATAAELPIQCFLCDLPNDKHTITTIAEPDVYAKELAYIASFSTVPLDDQCVARAPLSQHLQHQFLESFPAQPHPREPDMAPFQTLCAAITNYPRVASHPFTNTLCNLTAPQPSTTIIHQTDNLVTNAAAFADRFYTAASTTIPELKLPSQARVVSTYAPAWWTANRFHANIPGCQTACKQMPDLVYLTELILVYMDYLKLHLSSNIPVSKPPPRYAETLAYIVDTIFADAIHTSATLTINTLARAIVQYQGTLWQTCA